jgi:Uma2 family endonuclease
MGLPKLKTKISVEDYFEGEKGRQIRCEFISGEIYAMPDSSANHNRISMNLLVKLDSHLENSNNEVFGLNLKLKVNEDTFYYPDVFVACDKPAKSAYQREEPVLIIEVASPSTRQIDRREKLRAYQQMASVQEYAVVEQDKIHIELHRRQPDGRWITYFYNEGDFDEQIELQSVNLTTNLEEIYARVKFEE